jgi:hypothetical protein
MNKVNKLNNPNKLKYFIPPFVTRILNSLKSYCEFLPYANVVKKNDIYRDIHKGKRCFILGSGPSINDFDLNKLSNEIIIGLNSFYIHPDFNTIFSSEVPKYMLCAPFHGPEDQLPESHWLDLLKEHEDHLNKNITLFYGLGSCNLNAKKITEKYNMLRGYNLNYYFTSNVQDEWYSPNIKHFDFTKNLNTASTSSVWGIMLALYMGFDEIYLIGVDNNLICLPRDNPRFIKGGIGHINEQKITELGTFSWNYFTSFHLARTLKQYEFMNLLYPDKIYNCSKVSMADMFPFIHYDDILDNKQNLKDV